MTVHMLSETTDHLSSTQYFSRDERENGQNCQEILALDNNSMISSSPKSVARLIGVTVAGIPILTDVSHPASNIADTISVLPGQRDIKSHLLRYCLHLS